MKDVSKKIKDSILKNIDTSDDWPIFDNVLFDLYYVKVVLNNDLVDQLK